MGRPGKITALSLLTWTLLSPGGVGSDEVGSVVLLMILGIHLGGLVEGIVLLSAFSCAYVRSIVSGNIVDLFVVKTTLGRRSVFPIVRDHWRKGVGADVCAIRK